MGTLLKKHRSEDAKWPSCGTASDCHPRQFVTATALYCLLSADPNPPVMAGSYQVLPFSEEQVQQFALDLCEVLQFEFIFTQPCRQLETAVGDVLTQLRYKEILLGIEVCHVCVCVCEASQCHVPWRERYLSVAADTS